MVGNRYEQVAAVTSASLSDALGKLCGHSSHVLGLVSPTPDRVLFGQAAKTLTTSGFTASHASSTKRSPVSLSARWAAVSGVGTDRKKPAAGALRRPRAKSHRMKGLSMKPIPIFVIAATMAVSVSGAMTFSASGADDESSPIFGVKIPPIPRLDVDLRGPRRRRPQRSARHSGQRRSDQGLPGRAASVPGRHHHRPARLELRPVGGKRKSLWPSPIFRGRATQERGSVHGQGLRKYASTDGWGFAQFDDGKPASGGMHNTCFSCHATVKARDFVSNRYAP
jgi:hypothetical protein